jgi:hypothetical protein
MQMTRATYRPGTVNPRAAAYLLVLGNGYCRTQLLAVAARLGVADVLVGGPRSAQELAAATGAREEPLRRVMRALVALGVFTETEDGRFELTDASQPMRSDVPGSVRNALIVFGEDNYQPVGHLMHAVRTGEVPFDHFNGRTYYEWLSANTEASATFAAAMAELSTLEVSEALAAYDFSSIGTLVDVGGGNGHFVAGVLRAYPALRGVLVDLPAAVAGAADLLAAQGVTDRCQVVAGDFLREVPAGHDAYVLKRVLHNWDDATSTGILSSCRQALEGDGMVIVIERMLPQRMFPAPMNEIAVQMDTVLLAKHTGRTRTEEEFRRLFDASGLDLRDRRTTPAGFSILEARPARA